jgi:hypothetical protein
VAKRLFCAVCVLIYGVSSFVWAHHETLPAPDREYLKLISMHPFKDTLITQGNYNFFITVVESAPDTYDLYFYIENSLFKRPVHSDKGVLIYPANSRTPEKFFLTSDITGAASMRYIVRKPFLAKVELSTVVPGGKTISVTADIQLGSPKPSFVFLILFGLILAAFVIFIYIVRGRRINRK